MAVFHTNIQVSAFIPGTTNLKKKLNNLGCEWTSTVAARERQLLRKRSIILYNQSEFIHIGPPESTQ